MEPIVAAAQEGWEQGIRGGVAGSDSLYTGKARLMKLKDDTDVSPWPSQPSVTGNQPSHTVPIKQREHVMTRHYELGTVLSIWLIPDSSLPCIGVDSGQLMYR